MSTNEWRANARGPVHPIGRALVAAATGHFPATDGAAERVAPLPDSREAVLDMTAHAFVATALPTSQLQAWAPDGLGRAFDPSFLLWLAGHGGRVGSHDVVLARLATGGGTSMPRSERLVEHPRVLLATLWRTNVEVFADERGLITIGENSFGCAEVSVEVENAYQGRGVGQALIRELLAALPGGAPVFAHVAPGNTASLRAFLGNGFVPVASVVFLTVGARPDLTSTPGQEG